MTDKITPGEYIVTYTETRQVTVAVEVLPSDINIFGDNVTGMLRYLADCEGEYNMKQVTPQSFVINKMQKQLEEVND